MIDLRKYMRPNEQSTYAEYVCGRINHMERGSHLWMRIAKARNVLMFRKGMGEFRVVEHAIPFTDPYDLDAPVKVLHPDSMCLNELLMGGVHPPVEAHHDSKLLLINSDGSGDIMPKIESAAYRNRHDVIGEYVVDYRRCHDEAMGPLDYESAIEWILKKDIPQAVWGANHNRRQFAIVPRSSIPSDRTHRNDWKLKDLAA